MTDENLEFRPGTVLPTKDDKSWTFTLRDQFDRIWHADENISAAHVYDKAYEAKRAMREFCGVMVGE